MFRRCVFSVGVVRTDAGDSSAFAAREPGIGRNNRSVPGLSQKDAGHPFRVESHNRCPSLCTILTDDSCFVSARNRTGMTGMSGCAPCQRWIPARDGLTSRSFPSLNVPSRGSRQSLHQDHGIRGSPLDDDRQILPLDTGLASGDADFNVVSYTTCLFFPPARSDGFRVLRSGPVGHHHAL